MFGSYQEALRIIEAVLETSIEAYHRSECLPEAHRNELKARMMAIAEVAKRIRQALHDEIAEFEGDSH